MASAKLNDNQTRIRGSDVSGPSVRGGQTCINWSQLIKYKDNLGCYSILSLSIFSIPFLGRISHII